MKLGYKLSHAVLGRNVCLEVRNDDAEKIADYLHGLDVFASSQKFRDLVEKVRAGDLAALEKAANSWEFENKLREEHERKWS